MSELAPAERFSPLDLDLSGRVAVITGAGRGIGRACARGLAQVGADVVLVSRTKADLSEVAEEVRILGGSATPLVADVTDPVTVTAAFATLESVDVLVNAAGANIPEPFLEVSEDHLDHLVEVNLKAPFRVTRAAVAKMAAAGTAGAVVNISSQMGRVGAANRTVYCATKHGLEGLTRALAVELAPRGIRVNAVAPTFVETAMTEPFLRDQAFREDVVRQIPLGRIGQVGDVVGAVVFLASPAAGMITGASLAVDGGWTAQ